MGTNDLTEDRLLDEMLTTLGDSQMYTSKPLFITLTDANLSKLGWTKKAITALRELEKAKCPH